jgi:RNA polymerase sigma-70 factor (ECF subfamily)
LPAASQLRVVAAGLDQVADADLLARARNKDGNAFAVLVDRHFPVVHRVVWRMLKGHADAEDVAQEAFLRLWRDPAQVRDGAALKGWLMRVATNLVMDRYRAKPADQLDETVEVSDGRASADEEIDRGRAVAAIDVAVASLPERQKLALTLVHFEHMSNIAAAAIMEISVEALESLLARARRTLKERLAPNRNHLLATLAAERT